MQKERQQNQPRQASDVALGIYKQLLMDGYNRGEFSAEFVADEFARMGLKDK